MLDIPLDIFIKNCKAKVETIQLKIDDQKYIGSILYLLDQVLNKINAQNDALKVAQVTCDDLLDLKPKVSKIEQAATAYVIYSQSRDGIGKGWTSYKYKSTQDYRVKIADLFDVAERMQNVQVYNKDAMYFLEDPQYINNSDVMFYLDPSYLYEDVHSTEGNVKNLGYIYKHSYEIDDHKLLLEKIVNAKARIIISNYDNSLYNKYLNFDNGWSRLEVKRTSPLVSDGDASRTEVVWMNY